MALNLQAYLKEHTLLFDGAMGTWFTACSGQPVEMCETANLAHPEQVTEIHRAYLDAGCQAITSNTFAVGALFAQGEDTAGKQIIEAACRLAKDIAEPYHAFVFGGLGPVPTDGQTAPGEVYRRMIDLFLEQGIRYFLAETLPSDAGIAELAQYCKQTAPDSFVIVSYAVGADGVTQEGLSGQELFRRTAELPDVDAIGFNCMIGPNHMLRFLQNILRIDRRGKYISIMPNAGYPTVLGRRTVYPGGADYFAGQMRDIIRAGAKIIGGCCGTTPKHIAAVSRMLRDTPPVRIAVECGEPEIAESASESQNLFWNKLENKRRVIAVELDSPADDHDAPFLDGVRKLWHSGADVITIADCPVGRPRADSSIFATRLKRELQIEPLPHLTCRDRNLNATKALLLGLSMSGVHNVLLVTGDPIPTADRDEVKSVFNFNSRKLARFVSTLNQSLQTPFHIFGALNINARNFAIQLELAQEKEQNGVEGFLTQPVLSPEALENLRLARETLQGKILGGVFPIVSYRNACFLHNEIAGMRVCDEIIRLYEHLDREAGESMAVRISTEVIRAIQPYTDGVYLMTPFQRVTLVSRIIQIAKKQIFVS